MTVDILSGDSQKLFEWLWTFLTIDMTRGLLVFAIAYGVTRLIPAASGKTGHLIWLLVILSFTLFPLARLVLPALSLGHMAPSLPAFAGPPRVSPSGALSAVAAIQAAGRRTDLLPLAGAGIWLVGALFFASRSVIGRILVSRLAVEARESRQGTVVLRELKRLLGIRRTVTVLSSARCAVPFTYGLLRPSIILPVSARSWEPQRLRSVLTHELTHIRRMDTAWNLLTVSLCSLLWFVPLAWIALVFMQREAEKSCDREVLNHGMPGSDYASTLLELSRHAGGRIVVSGTCSFTAKKNMLKDRILAVLSSVDNSVPAGVSKAPRALVVCFVLLLPLVAITCSTSGTEKLYGKWSIGSHFNLTYNRDGTGSYVNSDGSQKYQSRFVVEKEWADGKGNTWYRVKEKWHLPPYNDFGAVTIYRLSMIDPAGTRMEMEQSESGYPKELFGAAGTGHALYTRQ